MRTAGSITPSHDIPNHTNSIFLCTHESKRRPWDRSDAKPEYPELLVTRINIATDHLTQLVFFGELSAQDLEVVNQALATVDNGLLRGNLAIGLNSQLEGRKEGMRD